MITDVNVGGYAYERINDHACKITYLFSVDVKGNVPHWVSNKVAESSAIKMYKKYTKQFGRGAEPVPLLSHGIIRRSLADVYSETGNEIVIPP